MILNGIPIKKYKAKVRNIIPMTTSPEAINTDEYKIVTGYISISTIAINYEKPATAEYHYVFVSEEVDLGRNLFSGFGKALFTPIMYKESEFEIIGEVEK